MKSTTILLFISLLLLTTINVAAQNWVESEAQTKNDALYIELPENIYQYIPVDVTVHIKDQITQQQANYIILDVANSHPYATTSGDVSIASSGNFREAMKYNGEETIHFGFRPIDQVGMSYVTVSFVYAEILPGNEYIDTSDETSEYYGFTDCNRETNSLLCGEGNEECTVCYKYISQVQRYYMIGSSESTATPPSGFDFTRDETNANAAHFSYSEETETPSSGGSTFTYTQYYNINVEIESFWEDLETMTDSFESFRQSEATPIGSLGGLTAQKAIEFVDYEPQREGYDYDYVDIDYYLYADMSPKNSGILKVEASRYVRLPAGSGDAELEEVKTDVKNVVSSFILTSGSVSEPTDDLSHNFYLYDRDEIEEEPEEQYAWGSVTDAFANPLPYCNLRILVDGKILEGKTDKDGSFQIPLVGIEPGEDGLQATLAVDFEYERDGTMYFNLRFRDYGDSYKKVIAGKKFMITKDENPEIRFNIDADPNYATWTTNLNTVSDIRHMGVIYYHMHEAVDFYLRVLDLSLDHKLPVTVWVGNTEGDTLYSQVNSDILIADSDASLSDTDRPKNREYHEFSHHVMYDIYGAWPEGDNLPGNINHNGFLNPSTADSFVEGFAEFMALVISDELSQDDSDIYGGFGSLEKNYQPWDGIGRLEEFAVASLLWDLYDNDNEDGDSLYYSIETLWEILKVKRDDFYEYYLALKEAKPKDADKIDELFVLHGFFADTRKGNGEYDWGEPWVYTNEATGEYRFIDLSDNVTRLAYEDGLVIGPARDYTRTNRTCAFRLPDSYISVPGDQVDFYTVQVTDASDGMDDYSYTVLRADDKIYLQPLPSNVDAKITVEPYSTAYSSAEPYEINNQQLIAKVFAADNAGYIDEHDFNLQSTGESEKYVFESFNSIAPSHQYEGDLGTEISVSFNDIQGDLDQSPQKNTPGFQFLILLLSLFFFVLINKKFR